ncbi:hypothetical protein R1sor_005505 [Riccia sorocarpa]|uniref:Uncharacterized protein n=1 Tax=Riccia sorocarpa TaxID=122646 RepID=A0ABD3HNA5_9MARC
MISEDYEALVTYIENPENFRQITSGGKKTRVDGTTLLKSRAFDIMASALSGVNDFPQYSQGDEEMLREIPETVQECSCLEGFYRSRMDVVLGKQPNIVHGTEESVGLPVDVEILSKTSQILSGIVKDDYLDEGWRSKGCRK